MPKNLRSDIIEILNRAYAGVPLGKLRYDYTFTDEEFRKWKIRHQNKFDVCSRSRRPSFSKPFYPLDRLADDLKLPFDSLIYFAAKGYLRTFFFAPSKKGFVYASVHKDFVGRDRTEPPIDEAPSAKYPILRISHLINRDVEGFFLSRDDCSVLLRGEQHKQSIFPAALTCVDGTFDLRIPGPPLFFHDQFLDIDAPEWLSACYSDQASFTDCSERGAPPPIEMPISLASLHALTDHIGEFLDVIYSDLFLQDLVKSEVAYSDARDMHLVEEKPAYVSAKLVRLVELSGEFWFPRPSDNPADYPKKRKKVRDELNKKDFLSNFTKIQPSEILLDMAGRFIEPLYARGDVTDETKTTGHRFLAPELLILLAASKLFWSPPHVDLANPASHPKNADIGAYLRIRGISGNDADYAITLIRPEQAAYGGRTKPFISLRDQIPRPKQKIIRQKDKF